MLTQETFLNQVETFLTRSGIKPTAFGKEVAGDPNLVRDLREGRSLSLRLIEKVQTFIDTADRPSRKRLKSRARENAA